MVSTEIQRLIRAESDLKSALKFSADKSVVTCVKYGKMVKYTPNKRRKMSFSLRGKICKIHGLFLGPPCKMPPRMEIHFFKKQEYWVHGAWACVLRADGTALRAQSSQRSPSI